MQSVGGDPLSGGLWAVTSYFNPMGYRRRRANYRIFRERLSLPLVAVELVYGAEPELGPDDAEILIQLRGSDVLWQKERLLDIAFPALPPACRKVVWIDCDVFVEDPAWPERVEALLETVPLAQPFSRVHHLCSAWRPGDPIGTATEFSRVSIAQAVVAGAGPAETLEHVPDRTRTRASGFVWAARRELIERHGLYDAAIIGGGDRLLCYASYGEFAAAARAYEMSARRRDHYRAWAELWHRDVGGDIGTLDCDLVTLWHGDLGNRGIGRRNEGLVAHGFDPYSDIAHDVGGAWRWNSDKPQLHRFVRDYFLSRREDGSTPDVAALASGGRGRGV